LNFLRRRWFRMKKKVARSENHGNVLQEKGTREFSEVSRFVDRCAVRSEQRTRVDTFDGGEGPTDRYRRSAREVLWLTGQWMLSWVLAQCSMST